MFLEVKRGSRRYRSIKYCVYQEELNKRNGLLRRARLSPVISVKWVIEPEACCFCPGRQYKVIPLFPRLLSVSRQESSTMALDECGLIFALVGFVFLGLGLKLRFSDSTRAIFEFETLNSSEFDMVVTVLIIMGSVMLIVVVFGDNGPLLTFSALVTILAGALIVFGVIANSRKDEIGLRIAEFYSSIYLQYLANGDPALADTLTFIQELLHCCGATGIPSLDFAKETCPKPNSFWENIKMDACPGAIVEVVNRNAPLVMGLFVGTGVSLVVALVCSIVLLIQTKREQQEITARYTTLQQEVIKPSNQFCPANPSSAGQATKVKLRVATNVKLRVATNVSCYASSDTYHKQSQLNFSSQLDHLPCCGSFCVSGSFPHLWSAGPWQTQTATNSASVLLTLKHLM